MQVPAARSIRRSSFGKCAPVRASRHPGNQGPSRICEGLTGIAVAIGGIGQDSSTGIPVLDSLRSTSSRAPRLSGALPGNTSTAVINWESVSTTIAALCPSDPPAAALVAVAHLRVMHRHHPVPAHPVLETNTVAGALHVLEQQLALSNSAAATMYLPLGAALRPAPCACRAAVQTDGPHQPQSRPPQWRDRLAVGPVDGRLSLDAGAQVPLSTAHGTPGPRPIACTLVRPRTASARMSLTIPSASRLQVSLTAPRPRMFVVSSATLMPRAFSGSPICRAQAQLDLEHRPHRSWRINWARNTWSVLLAKGRSSISMPRATFPADVEVGPGLGLGVAHLVVGLQQQGCSASRLGHAVLGRCRRSRTWRNRCPGTVGPATMPAVRRTSPPYPRGPGTTGPPPIDPSDPIALPALSFLAVLDVPKYSRSPDPHHFPARFLVWG